MDVKIKRLSGCMRVMLWVLTLGLWPFFLWLNSRNWPKSMDDKGLVTHKGSQIGWDQVTRVRKVITKSGSNAILSEHFELASPKGKVILMPSRLEDSGKVMDYVWQHIPEEAMQSK